MCENHIATTKRQVCAKTKKQRHPNGGETAEIYSGKT